MNKENNSSNSPLGVGGNINTLFPVFFKLEQLHVLLIGAGNVALEKLQAIVNNAPRTKVTVVAREISEAFKEEANKHSNINVITTEYAPHFLEDCDLVIAAVNDIPASERIRHDARQKGKLINVADKPDLCDFYLGSIVTKGNLKLAISTNGKSPTIAKRLREVFSELLPDELEDVLGNLQEIRNKLKGDFAQKVQQLNELTRVLLQQEENQASQRQKK